MRQHIPQGSKACLGTLSGQPSFSPIQEPSNHDLLEEPGRNITKVIAFSRFSHRLTYSEVPRTYYVSYKRMVPISRMCLNMRLSNFKGT